MPLTIDLDPLGRLLLTTERGHTMALSAHAMRPWTSEAGLVSDSRGFVLATLSKDEGKAIVEAHNRTLKAFAILTEILEAQAEPATPEHGKIGTAQSPIQYVLDRWLAEGIPPGPGGVKVKHFKAQGASGPIMAPAEADALLAEFGL